MHTLSFLLSLYGKAVRGELPEGATPFACALGLREHERKGVRDRYNTLDSEKLVTIHAYLTTVAKE